MFEIILNILNYPELIVLGTFFRTDVNLGGGPSTGKLKFSNIVTNGILVEDSTGITISTFFNQAIDFCQIAVGNGTGITSSKFFYWQDFSAVVGSTRSPRLIGPGMINPVRGYGSNSPGWDSNCNVNWGLYNHSFIINGCCNQTGDSKSSGEGATLSFSDLIIGGYCNCSMWSSNGVTSSFHNVILNGNKAWTLGSRGDVIIGMGRTVQTCFNVIINSSSYIDPPSTSIDPPTRGSVIISSIYDVSEVGQSSQTFKTMIKNSYNSTIISSIDPTINYEKRGLVCNGLIISSNVSEIKTGYAASATTSVHFNSIIGSHDSTIYGGNLANLYGTSITKPSSCFSVIISSCNSSICDSKLSSIIGGLDNIIYNDFSNSVDDYCRDLVGSSIIGGCQNTIRTYNQSLTEPVITTPSTIIGGCKNLIGMYKGRCGGNSIIGGFNNYIFGRNSAIISSAYSELPNGYESVIISSYKSCMPAKSTGSLIISSSKTYQRGYDHAVDISTSDTDNYGNCIGCSSLRLSTSRALFDNNGVYMNSIIASYGFLGSPTIIGSTVSIYSCYNTIIGARTSVIRESRFSSILFDSASCMCQSYQSIIMSGCKNSAGTKTLASAIIGGYENCLLKSINSVIVGGFKNKIGDVSLITSNSVILGGSYQTLTFSNTVMTRSFNFSCAEIFINNTQCCNVLVGTFSNCFYCSLKIRNGFIVS